jgi:glycosyltransferase involved in cell wall biosynthesis
VAESVFHVRERGVDVGVVSPADFQHHGIAYGAGIITNIRRRPRLALLLPAFLARFIRAAREATRDADLVHAHWLPTGVVALATGRPFVLHVHGSDLELAGRAPALARPILRRARVVICVSRALADAARALGAERVRVIPNGVEIPDDVPPPSDPPEILFAGRLVREKGVLELVAAAEGYPLTVVGDGPLREAVPNARGFVDRDELSRLYARAAVVACPSYREGFGVVCAEAMAHGRPVVASAVGGLRDLVEHERTGLLVPPRDVAALRRALERLLADDGLRRDLGAAARQRARKTLSWERVTSLTVEVYSEALA